MMDDKELIAAVEPILKMLEHYDPVGRLQILEVAFAAFVMRGEQEGIPRKIVIDAMHKHVTQLCGKIEGNGKITVRDLQTVRQ